jgi:transglutaminase-like putative cysteine protease
LSTPDSYSYFPKRSKFMLAMHSIFINWQQKLRVVLTSLILAQFVVWFEVYWLSATTWLVSAALVTTCVIEMFTRFHWVIRRSVVPLLIVLTHFETLNISWIYIESSMFNGKFGPFADVLSSVGYLLTQTSPYIWFALGTWLVYISTLMWLAERARIMLIIVISVILFAIVDSYSQYIFWDQVAFIIFSGLGLMVIEHFENFKRKHPASWAYFGEYPFVIATPVVLIIALVMIAGSLAPNAPPILTDPYTAYMHYKGMVVNTSGKNFSSTSSTRLLDPSSGYGRDDSVLGGGFDFDYTEVMRLETDQRIYLRGETKSLYTGEGWEPSDRDVSAAAQNVTFGTKLEPFDWGTVPLHKSVDIEQEISVTDAKSFPVLFGAYPISSLNSTGNVQGEMDELPSGALWSSAQGELRWKSEIPYPLTYTVTSTLPILDEEALLKVPSVQYEGEQWDPYLQLPETLPDRVRVLTEDITRGVSTPYEKVKRIEDYLRTNFEYTNRPDVSKGESIDFVDQFLFEIQSGYCDYFSTSMAVMVRTLGLPARWVKGYTGGTLDVQELIGAGLPEEFADLTGIQTYVVRNSDAHSWVEVYFAGWGWLPFEPTSGFVLPAAVDTATTVEPATDSSIDPSLINEGDNSLVSLFTFFHVIVTVTIIVLGVTVWLLGIRLGWWNHLRILRSRRRQLNMNQQALQEIGKIIRMFRRKGYIRHVHETARESFTRWINQNRWLKKDLEQLLGVLEKAQYSPYSISGDDFVLIVKTKRKLKEEL